MEVHRKKIKSDLRSVWDEWSKPHEWGLWQENPQPTLLEEAAAAAGVSEAPDVGADAGGAVEVMGTPAPKGHQEVHSVGHSEGSEEEEEEEGGGGGSKGGGGGGGGQKTNFSGYTPSKKILKLAEQVHNGTASKNTLIDQLKSVKFAGKQIGEGAVALATYLAKNFDKAVVSIGDVVAPRAAPPRAKSVAPAKRAESKPKAPAAEPAAKAPPAPKGSPAPAPAASAEKQLKSGVRITGKGHYYMGGRRIPASQAYK